MFSRLEFLSKSRAFRIKLSLILCVFTALTNIPLAKASEIRIQITSDYLGSYNRSQFKHWTDEDKDGCNTRAEVLIEEAVVKPKIGKGCTLNGGKWISSYDEKIITKASALDIDHLVPLAEAWRSGAWNWTAIEREKFANDLTNSQTLLAVSLGMNRSKGDKDPAKWLPLKNQCKYIQDWLFVKSQYKLNVDEVESNFLSQKINECGILEFKFHRLEIITNTESPSPSSSTSQQGSSSDSTDTGNTSTKPSPSATFLLITAGAFCSSADAGKQGKNAKGIVYTCKISSTENRLRWRL